MEFGSTAEMVRHYCNELLADGQAHSLSEMSKFVSLQTGGRGINGELLPRNSVNNEIRNLDCEKLRRGIYRKRVDMSQCDISPQVFIRASRILNGAVYQLNTLCKINLLSSSLSIEKSKILIEKCQKIASLLGEAKKIAQSLAHEELDQAETPGPIPTPPNQGMEAIERDDGLNEPERLLPMSVAP